ncbi:MAG: DNA/RNA helicase, partial [Chloroflexi bacterium]|nr:DNA/RNA helicase [Chloroflexota bacterium]
YDYLEDLERDPEGVKLAIQQYSAVLAATCQQSIADPVLRIKGVDKLGDMHFDTVIVDEAARAMPLDLLIPMAQTKRRIILVGDHRQLPHVLEEDVEREVEKSQSPTTQEVLKKSLFERLFAMMRERERIDGVKRTITLDQQYRMHPVLGRFVSKAFYDRYGEGFGDGLPPESFSHQLSPYEERVAAWVNVPFLNGGEIGRQSKRRPYEAKRVARELRNLIDQDSTLTFGVISFYTGQVQEIMECLCDVGLTERDESGNLRIAPGYRETRDAEGKFVERLRVGTVDAFQGKEFDVVILSVTRSNQLRGEDERTLRRKYGFLLLENRLCVAMSRQKRLLIVVGDESMLDHPAAEHRLAGLVAFHQLCTGGSPYGIRV